jgi:hypothetical protein
VALTGILESVGGRQSVSVKNLSCTGAQLEGSAMPQSGREVILRAGSLDCFATVAWSGGTRCGIRFEEPLEMEEVLALHQITSDQVEAAEKESIADWFSSQGRYARF